MPSVTTRARRLLPIGLIGVGLAVAGFGLASAQPSPDTDHGTDARADAAAGAGGTEQNDRFRVVRDIPYAEIPGADPTRLSLDVYSPVLERGAGDGYPVMVFIHGGAWALGDKSRVDAKPAIFVENGWVFVSINYRLSPEVIHPAHVHDAAAAVAWVRDNIAEHGGDGSRIAVMGHSAGAHLAALLATHERPLGREGMERDELVGVVLLDGAAYDAYGELTSGEINRTRERMYRRAFGDRPATWLDASPTRQVLRDRVDAQTNAGTGEGTGDHGVPGYAPLFAAFVADRAIAELESERLVQQMRLSGADALSFGAEDETHRSINRGFGLPSDETTERVLVFLKDALNQE